MLAAGTFRRRTAALWRRIPAPGAAWRNSSHHQPQAPYICSHGRSCNRIAALEATIAASAAICTKLKGLAPPPRPSSFHLCSAAIICHQPACLDPRTSTRPRHSYSPWQSLRRSPTPRLPTQISPPPKPKRSPFYNTMPPKHCLPAPLPRQQAPPLAMRRAICLKR